MGMLEQRANLTGRIAAVIGGAFGIGEAVTLSLASAGIDVAFCDIRADALDRTRVAVEKLGRRATAMHADATDPQQLSAFYAHVAADFAQLDIVVNVVGGTYRRKFMESTPEDWASDIQRNYIYVLHSVRNAVPLMRKGARGGSIVNFTTIEAHRGAPTFAVYSGAKAGLANFTRSLAAELGAENIRVNAVAPEHTPSAGNDAALGPSAMDALSRVPAEIRAEIVKLRTPLKRVVSATDLANVVLFLASDLASGVTGMTVHADGGSSACMGFLDWPYGDGQLPIPLAGSLMHLYR